MWGDIGGWLTPPENLFSVPKLWKSVRKSYIPGPKVSLKKFINSDRFHYKKGMKLDRIRNISKIFLRLRRIDSILLYLLNQTDSNDT